MRRTAALLTGMLPMIVAAAMPASPTLSTARGRERVLILFPPAAGEARLAAQDRLLAPEGAGLKERDLRVVRVVGDAVAGLPDGGAALRARFGVPVRTFAVRLIGKDGHVAIARATPITISALFRTIDAMPMRRNEMHRRR